MKFELHPFRDMLKEGIQFDTHNNKKNVIDNFEYIRCIIDYIKDYVEEYESMFCYSDEEQETCIYILTRTQIIRFTMLSHYCDAKIESYLVSDIKKITINQLDSIKSDHNDCEWTIDFGFEKICIKCLSDYEDVRAFFKRIIQLR